MPPQTSFSDNNDHERNPIFEPVGKQVEGMNSDQPTTEDDAPDEGRLVDTIESLCMNCHENGETRLLLTKIPYFREIILMSFACAHCGFSNTEIQSAGEIQQQGSKTNFKLMNMEDFERQVVKSDTAILRIEEIDLEMPAGLGKLSNVEGLVSGIMLDLQLGQPTRKEQDPASFQKLEFIIEFLTQALVGERFPLTISIDDPAGNSTIEGHPADSKQRNRYVRTEYNRTKDQNAMLGLGSEETPMPGKAGATSATDAGSGMDGVDILEGEVYSLPADCPGCGKPATVNMQMVNVPHFKQCIISAVTCEACGYRTNDVKTGGEVPEKGKRLTLHVKSVEDLSRDILKSETCSLSVPECECELVAGCLGGRFTTVEGLLRQVREELSSHIFKDEENEAVGDGVATDKISEWKEFFSRLDRAMRAEFPFRVILSDPLADSYIQNPLAPDSDPQLSIEEFERSVEDNEDLGLNDMKTRLADDGRYVAEDRGKSITEIVLEEPIDVDRVQDASR